MVRSFRGSPIYNRVSKWLYDKRIENKLSQYDVAKRLHVHQSRIAKLENHYYSKLNLVEIIAYCKFGLQVDAKELVTEIERFMEEHPEVKKF